MNPFQPPPNARKVKIENGSVVHTPDSFLELMSSYKRQNPVKFSRKEAAFKKKFVALGGKIQDFKLKVVKSREELEAEIAELKAKVETTTPLTGSSKKEE